MCIRDRQRVSLFCAIFGIYSFIVEKLKDLHLDENTVIIWLADHGDALGCHGGHFDKACLLYTSRCV